MAKYNNYFIKGDDDTMKWYKKGWVIFLFLLFLFPVGVFLLWKYGNWRKSTKIIATVVFAFICLMAATPMPEVEADMSAEANEPIENISEPKETKESLENSEPTIQVSKLFEDVYLPYVQREKSISFENIKPYASTSEYVVEIIDSSDALFKSIKFNDIDGNYVYMTFDFANGVEVIRAISYVHASSNIEVLCTNTSNNNNLKYNQYRMHVIGSEYENSSGIDDQIEFLAQAKPKSESIIEPKPEPVIEPKPEPVVEPIQPQAHMVWIPTNGGKKYHSHSSCSGMENPSQVTISEAQARGFTPCKRCY